MTLSRREFLKNSTLATGALITSNSLFANSQQKKTLKKPNVVFILVDQLRAQDLGYAGNKQVITPHIDRLAEESHCFVCAVSCMPVSTPYRGSLLTGQYATTHGLFVNDVPLDPNAKTMGKIYKEAGYDTAYIGKWHINGNGRSQYIPRERRQGFDYFKALECTHDYNHSYYYDNDNPEKKLWNGYDVFAQTDDAISYMDVHSKRENPFLLVLSWGTPHNPYQTAPDKYQALYDKMEIDFRPNVPDADRSKAEKDIKGYYAHITALDDSVGRLQEHVKKLGIEQDTLFIFTSDHGDMLYSHGVQRKQKPFNESIMVPFLVKYPALLGHKQQKVDIPIGTVDILPTMLSMCSLPIPKTVEGRDLLPVIQGKKKDDINGVLIECITPFGEWERRNGGKEYRGVRTRRYTYTRDLNGPWLLFDNEIDPYQKDNLINRQEVVSLQRELDQLLNNLIARSNDNFMPGDTYIKKWGYITNENGTVPYTQ